MGISILEMVLRCLREENFRADIAYPGQMYPKITEPVAAVHIEKVDRANLTVTVEVTILCPASVGGTACEVEALRATEALRWSGAVCVQNGCSYDGVAQVYMVSILASYTCIAEEDDCTLGPGFYVFIEDMLQPDAVAFSEEELPGYALEYVTAQSTPVGYSGGCSKWSISLEELIPIGTPEPEEPAGEFTLLVVTDQKTETYSGCRWTAIQRTLTKEGLRRVRKGIARSREEE